MAISPSLSLSSASPFSFLQSKPQLANNSLSISSNSSLNYSNLSLKIKRRAINGSTISGYLKKLYKRGDNGGLSVCMCSTTPFIGFGGRVGLHRRLGNVSLLSFGDDASNQISGDASKGGGSQNLSAILPFVVVATAVAALSQPSSFTWVSKELYAPALGGIMLSIGIRLSIDDFALAFQRPLPLSLGFLAQYVVKPALGVLIAQAFGVSPMFYAGFVLTACVAGAQLSSYASFLSKGDVALSVLLTSSSTIASVIVTPLLTRLLIGSVVPVDAVAMSKSILQVVLVPISLGLFLNTYAKAVVNRLQPVMPIVAMACTSLCIGSPLAINRSQILSAEGFCLIAPVLAFHAASFTLGYWLSKLPNMRRKKCPGLSHCAGMQSSTLAGLLATQFLGSSQAVPSACSVVAMAIMGLSLASFWGNGLRIRETYKAQFSPGTSQRPRLLDAIPIEAYHCS